MIETDVFTFTQIEYDQLLDMLRHYKRVCPSCWRRSAFAGPKKLPGNGTWCEPCKRQTWGETDIGRLLRKKLIRIAAETGLMTRRP